MSRADDTPHPHPGLSFIAFVLMMAALQAIGALGVDVMLPNLSAIAADLGLHAANLRQWVITAYLIGMGGGQILYGVLSDRFGRRPVLMFGLAAYVVFSAVAAFSPTFHLLVFARLLQGVGAASTRAMPVSIIRDCYAGRQMARVMSLSFMTFMAVPMLAPSLGQAIALFASWRWVFGVLTLFSGAVFAWAALKLPETLHPEDRSPIDLAQVRQNFGLVLRSRVGMGYAFASTFIMGALFSFINAGEQLFEFSFKAAALFPAAFALIAGCMALSSLLNSRVVERFGMRPLSHGALLAFIAISSLHALVALSGRETIVTFAVLQAATMLGFGLLVGNFGAMGMESLGHVAGSAASLQGSLTMVGGSLIGVFIGQQFNGTSTPIVLGFVVCGLCSLVCVLYAEHGRLFGVHHARIAEMRP